VPFEVTRKNGRLRTLRLGPPRAPLAVLGLDRRSTPEAIPEDAFATLEQARLDRSSIRRRDGAEKIEEFSHVTGSITFGADSKYGKVTAASPNPLLLPVGSWAVRFSCVATRPSAGQTAYLWSNRVNGQTYGALWATLSDAGVLTASFRTAAGATVTATSGTISAGATVHGWLVFDAIAGTFTIYVNGASSGTPATGISATTQVLQTALDWYFGVEYDPAAVGVTANTHFDGALDAWMLKSFAGVRLTEGSPTLLSVLLANGYQEWPAPFDDTVRAYYDFNEGSGTTAKDRSRYKRHMTLTGGPSWTSALCPRSAHVNLIGQHKAADGERTNLVVAGGRAFYEIVRGGTT